jgi:hypothetical protein
MTVSAPASLAPLNCSQEEAKEHKGQKRDSGKLQDEEPEEAVGSDEELLVRFLEERELEAQSQYGAQRSKVPKGDNAPDAQTSDPAAALSALSAENPFAVKVSAVFSTAPSFSSSHASPSLTMFIESKRHAIGQTKGGLKDAHAAGGSKRGVSSLFTQCSSASKSFRLSSLTGPTAQLPRPSKAHRIRRR